MARTKFEQGKIYHIFNRGVEKRNIFLSDGDRWRFLQGLYLFNDEAGSLNLLYRLEQQKGKMHFGILRDYLRKAGIERKPLVRIMADCLKPNHFHLLLKQNIDDGITMLMRNFQISYTKYLNTKYDRTGPLLQGQFKVARIEDDEQLLHVSRYIHLNPFTSYHLGEIESLTAYPWSSLAEYLDLIEIENEICKKELILSNFKNKDKYKAIK